MWKWCLIVIAIGLFLTGIIYVPTNIIKAEESSSSYISHNAIVINGDKNFTSKNGVVGGSGTEEDPYVIEGWDISYNMSLGQGLGGNILISNTKAYFIVRNCMLEGQSLLEQGMSLIFLDNVSNGKFENITSSSNFSTMIGVAKSNNCIFKNCDIGFISFNSSKNNQVVYCEFSGGTVYSNIFGTVVYFDKSSVDNYIHHNNFYVDLGEMINLTGIGGESLLEKSSGNHWYDAISKEGNYWIGYSGPDSNGDGVIDTPYDVPGTEDKDLYPLKNPVSSAGNLFGEISQNNRPIARFSYSPKNPDVGEKIQFTDLSMDPDGDKIISWHWNFGDGNTSDLQNPTHIYTEKSPYFGYVVTLTVTDSRGATSKPDVKYIIVGGANFTNSKPTIQILNPENGDKVSGEINITGVASDPDEFDVIKSVKIRAGGKEWYNATLIYNYTTGNTTWYYIWDTTKLISGEVTIRAKAIDLHGAESNEATITVTVEKTSSGGSGGTPGFETVLTLLAITVVFMFFRKKR